MIDLEFEDLWSNMPYFIRQYIWKDEFKKMLESEKLSNFLVMGEIRIVRFALAKRSIFRGGSIRGF